jgi:hypothetical protein
MKMQALEAVQAVEAVAKSQKRLPEGFKQTVYSSMDLWHYVLEEGANHCEYCKGFADKIFLGSELRTWFPDHIVESENKIYVNYHMTLWGKDTCKCYLYRVDSAADPYSSKYEPEIMFETE